MTSLKVFTPLKVRYTTLKNRFVMPAMHLNFTVDGEVTPQLIEFYKERAKGGVALISVGGCAIDRVGASPLMLRLDEDWLIDEFKKFTKKVKVNNCVVIAQLYHAGRYALSNVFGLKPLAPSDVPTPKGEVPQIMTKEDIISVQQKFCDAAKRAIAAEFEGVEIIASAGYLICQFLSSYTNKREDEYGGSFENRMRFGIEVISKVRKTIGDKYPLFVRLAGQDFVPNSSTNAEIAIFAKALQDAGADAFNVTGGWHETKVPQITMSVPRANYAYLAKGIKEKVSIPVSASNRINNISDAEKIIKDGVADLVSIGRALICDPQFVNKCQQKKYNLIRTCIGCNQGCFDAVFQGVPIGCMLNAQAGKEYKTKVVKSPKKKKVVIIGAGPGGCEAARVCAEAGHQVILFEKENKIGGQLHLVYPIPLKKEFKEVVNYYTEILKHYDIKLQLNNFVTSKKILKENPDVIIVATGAKPYIPEIKGVPEGLQKGWVVTYEDVLSAKVSTGKNVVVLGGGATGVEVALYLGYQGIISPETLFFLFTKKAETIENLEKLTSQGTKNVTIIKRSAKIGKGIGRTTRWTLVEELKRIGVEMYENTKTLEVSQDGVLVENGKGKFVIKADSIVLASGMVSENKLYNEIKNNFTNVYLIGDAKKPAYVTNAVWDAFELGINI